MTELQIQLPPSLDAALADRVSRGGYLDAGDYVRDLLRRDLGDLAEGRRLLKVMIDQGIASGLCEKDAFDTLQEVIDEDPDLRD